MATDDTLEITLERSAQHPPQSKYCFNDRFSLADAYLYAFLANASRFGMDRREISSGFREVGRIWDSLDGEDEGGDDVLGRVRQAIRRAE